LSDGEAFQVDGINYAVTSAAGLAASATGYAGAVTALPSTVSYKGWELSVESVGKSAFLRCATLTSVNLSNVKVLEYKALGNCTGIEHIVFGDALESIGSYALHGLSFYDGDVKLSVTPDALRGAHLLRGRREALSRCRRPRTRSVRAVRRRRGVGAVLRRQPRGLRHRGHVRLLR
ncbi:MAG: leucine-rich repeat protein, partial [Candidatus Methanomethylophilaceae archaeon]|nr:leucine-rich repeat protein [Candidatus Methanomethylophilaceae archaeon]